MNDRKLKLKRDFLFFSSFYKNVTLFKNDTILQINTNKLPLIQTGLLQYKTSLYDDVIHDSKPVYLMTLSSI